MQVSFRPEVERDARPGAVELGFSDASSSRYADPEAEGVTPVLRTGSISLRRQYVGSYFLYLHIFLSTLGALVLVGLSGIFFASLARYLEYIGALVPPAGPLILLLSVMVCAYLRQ